jgi:tRNA threonylcarbamoyladenosine biosynthesis protein TsaB
MYTLAIDTSAKTASAALLRDDEVIVEVFVNVGLNHSEVLLPAIDNICRTAGIRVPEIDLFACTTGPGSFTGLRIGAATVKGMALANAKPIAGVSTLDALAFNVAESRYAVCPMLDARKSQVYAAIFRSVAGEFPEKTETESVTDVSAFVERLTTEDNILFLGDGATAYAGKIREIMGGRASFALQAHNHIRASAVGMIGLHNYRKGLSVDAVAFVPLYLRQSEAEINRARAEQG